MVSGPYLDFDPQPFVKASILFLALLLTQHADGQSLQKYPASKLLAVPDAHVEIEAEAIRGSGTSA